jgi:hypothetical protein
MKKQNNELFSIKILLIYGIIFSIGYWISTLTIPFIKTKNIFVVYLLTGIILELCAKTCQMFLYKKPKITLDKWFVIWVLIHSVVVYGVVYLTKKINLSSQYLFILMVGFGIAIITHIIWRFMYGKKGFKSPKPKPNTKIFNLIKIPFSIFTIFILLTSIYLTFTTFFIGLFIPPIVCIVIAGIIIRFFDKEANGKNFLWNTLALAGVFLSIVVLILYRMIAPIFEIFG